LTRHARIAWLAACACLIALIFLCVAWELFVAPVRPGGSWLVLKVIPLLAALRGVLGARRYTLQWSTLVIWLYAAEGAMRTYTDVGTGAVLAGTELALALGYFAAAVASLRAARSAGRRDGGAATPTRAAGGSRR
jgi:uncharacterized membrane protein